MKMVQQTPDGLVVVRSDDLVYIDTPDNFTLDFGEAPPAMPIGAIDHVYEQGKRNAYTDGETIVAGGPIPWAAGDRYIASVQGALDNRVARLAAVPVPDPPPGRR